LFANNRVFVYLTLFSIFFLMKKLRDRTKVSQKVLVFLTNNFVGSVIKPETMINE